MGKSSNNSHAKKSDKETQSPVLKIFKDIMQRENTDLEKTTLVKDKRNKKKKQYSSIRSTTKSDQRSECSEPARQDTQSTVKEKNKKFSEKFTHSSGPASQNFEKKDSWWVWREQQKASPDIKNASTNCSCASCQLKKIISHEYACIGCLLCFFTLSIIIALMLLFKSMHTVEGGHGISRSGSTTTHISPTTTRSGAAKHLDKPGHKKIDLSRAIRRSIGNQFMLGKDSGIIGLSEPDFCLDTNFQDIDRLVQPSESRNDLTSILDPNKFNDVQVSPRLRDFYKKLIETDAQIKNLKKGIYESATLTNYAGKNNFYRLKRSALRLKRNKNEHGNSKEKRDVNDGDPMTYQSATTVLLPDPNSGRNFAEMIKEGEDKGNKRHKRLDTKTESSIIVEKKQLIVQYVDPSKATLPTFPKCSHVAKNNDKLTLIQNEKAKKYDDMFEHFIDNNWYSLNMKMHDAILDELRKSWDAGMPHCTEASTSDSLKKLSQKDFFTLDDDQQINEPYNKLIQLSNKPKENRDKESGAFGSFEDRLNKYQDKLRKLENQLRHKQNNSQKHLERKIKPKVMFESSESQKEKKGQKHKKNKLKKHRKHDGESKNPKDFKLDHVNKDDGGPEYCDEKVPISNGIGGISPIGQDTSDDENNVQYKKHLKHHNQEKHRHDPKNDNEVNKRPKKKHRINLFGHSLQDNCDDNNNSQKKKQGKCKNDQNDEDLGDDDKDGQRDKRGKKKNDYNSQDDSEYDDGQTALKKMSDNSGQDYSTDLFKVGPSGGDDLIQPKLSHHSNYKYHNRPNKLTVPKNQVGHKKYNEDSYDNNPLKESCNNKSLSHKNPYGNRPVPYDENPQKEPCNNKSLSHKNPFDDNKEPDDKDEPEPKDEPCDDQPKNDPWKTPPRDEPCDDKPQKEPCDDKPQKEPYDDKPQKEPCDDKPQKEPYDDKPQKEPCYDKPQKETCDDEPPKLPYEDKKESCVDKPKTEPSDDNPNEKPCDENPKKDPCDKPYKYFSDRQDQDDDDSWVSSKKSKMRPVTPKIPNTTNSCDERSTTLSSIMKDVTRKLKEMTHFIKHKHKLLEEKAKEKKDDNTIIKFKNDYNFSDHRIIKRDMNAAYYYKTKTPAPIDVVVSLYTVRTDTFSPPKFMSRLPSRRLMQAIDYEVEDVGYEDLKEVLSDDKDSHDETDRQVDRRQRNLPDNHFDDVENGINGISSETSKDTTLIGPFKMMNRYHPLGMNSQNSKDLMPLYPDELSAYVKNWVDETTVPIKKLDYYKVDHSGSYSDASDEEYLEGFHHYDSEGKRVSFAQAYSDYGVINAKKLQTENVKKDDKRVKLSDKKEKNLGPSEGILVQYKSDGDRDDDPKELIQMLQKHLRFSKPKPKTYNKYVSHTTLVPMSPEFDIVYNPISHLMIKEKKKPKYPEYGYGVGKSLRSLKSINYDYLDQDSANSDETIDISPIYKDFTDMSTQGYITSEELLYDPSEDDSKTTKETFPNIFLVTTEKIKNVYRNKKHISSREIHWGNITVNITHCIGSNAAKAKPSNQNEDLSPDDKKDDKKSETKCYNSQGKNKNKTKSITIDKSTEVTTVPGKCKKKEHGKKENGKDLKIDIDSKTTKPEIDKTTKTKKGKLLKSSETWKNKSHDDNVSKLGPDFGKMLKPDVINTQPLKLDIKKGKALKIKIDNEKEMKADIENDSQNVAPKNEDELHDKALKAELKNDKALTAETLKEKALTEKLANVSDAAEKLANDFKTAVDALKKATAQMSQNSVDQLVDTKSFLTMLGKWFKALERVTPADKNLGTTEYHPMSYTRSFNHHGLQKNHSGLTFYPMYYAEADVEKLLQNDSRLPDMSTEPLVIVSPNPEPENKTIVKRSAVGSNLVFWNDIYDDEYGIKMDPVENHLKEKGVNNDLMKKSSIWLQEKVKRMSDSIKRKSRDSFNKIYGKRDSRSSIQHGHNVCDKPMKKSSEDSHSLNKRNSLKTLAMHMNVSDLSAHIRGVCKKAAQEVHRTKSSKDSENTVENAMSTTLMQKLVQLMSELVDYQVQQKTCIKLQEDLKDFLEWLTVLGPAGPPNMGTDNSQSKENPIHLEGGIDLATTPSSEREEHDARSECLGTLHAVETLMNEYSHLSDEDKNKMIGVKEYLEDQLEFLTKQLSSIDELSLANIYGRGFMPFRYRRDQSHNMRKRNAHSPFKRRRNKRKLGRYMKNYSRKHTKTTASIYESVQVSTEMFKQQFVERPKLDLTEKDELAVEVRKRETNFFSEPENITKRNLQDVYYKALEEAKKTTKLAKQIKVLNSYDKTVTDSLKT